MNALWRFMLRHGGDEPQWDEWIAYRVLYGRHAAFTIQERRHRV